MSSHTKYAEKFPDLFAAAKAISCGGKQLVKKTSDDRLVYSVEQSEGKREYFDGDKIIKAHAEASAEFKEKGEKELVNAEKVIRAISDTLKKLYQMEALKGIEMSENALKKTAKVLGNLAEI